MVPERASEVAANGDEARKQNGGQVLAGRVPGDGHVPRAHGLHPVAAGTQPALQRHGRPAQPKLHGLRIASPVRLMSADSLHWTFRTRLILRVQLALCLTLLLLDVMADRAPGTNRNRDYKAMTLQVHMTSDISEHDANGCVEVLLNNGCR